MGLERHPILRWLALIAVVVGAVAVAVPRAPSAATPTTASAYGYDSPMQHAVPRQLEPNVSSVAAFPRGRHRGAIGVGRAVLVAGVAAEAGLAGSGPVPGVLEVSGRVKSVGAFRNYNPRGGVEYVFDPATSRFAVGSPRPGSGLKGSPHQQLADSIGADQSGVVGGMLRRGPGGEFITDEMSGHFHQNWSPAVRSQFVDFMQGFGLNVVH